MIQSSPTKESLHGEDDPIVCAACLDGTVYDNNEIIFCDKCNVAVHQTCYGVFNIPDGPWFCQVCAAGGDPSKVECDLCSNFGGAYKSVDKINSGRWAHAICATWIPEIYAMQINDVSVLNFSYLDKKRFRLKCALCTTKGACIQCSYGRCTNAAHPWCVMFNPKGVTHRIVKDEEGETQWEIFCKTHASAVSDPVRPKVKAKSQPLFAVHIEEPEVVEHSFKYSSSHFQSTSSSSASKPAKISMAHALKFRDSQADGEVAKKKPKKSLYDSDEYSGGSDESSSSNEDGRGQHRSRANSNAIAAKTPRGNTGAGPGTGKGGKGTKLNDRGTSANRNTTKPNEIISQKKSELSFPVRILSEWPGQSEGEGIDLDHFWNVISMSYPEDHPAEWAKYMANPYTNHNSQLSSAIFDANILELVPLGDSSNFENPSQSSDGRYDMFPSERDRFNLLDVEKRSSFLDGIYSNISNLSRTPLQSLAKTPDWPSLQNFLSSDSSIEGSSIVHDVGARAIAEDDLFMVKFPSSADDDDKYLELSSRLAHVGSVDDIRVVFDGPDQRYACEMNVCYRKEDEDEGERSYLESLEQSGELDLASNVIIQGEQTDLTVPIAPFNEKAYLSLSKFQSIDPSVPIELSNKFVIPKDEDDEMCRVIRSDQVAYKRLCDSLRLKLVNMFASSIEDECGTIAPRRKIWSALEETYTKQQIWRKVAKTIFKGMRDQGTDFNKHEQESIPASWMLRVDGRNVKPGEEEDAQEDAICMCCFDGSSSDGNCILFCDGCNAALHQACYGVPDIPEGDFYCNRCADLRAFASKVEEIPEHFDSRSYVMCCLCPVQHGGLKPTTDGRYVHMCCAIWSKNACIEDLEDMEPIDISKVLAQEPVEEDTGSSSTLGIGRRGRPPSVRMIVNTSITSTVSSSGSSGAIVDIEQSVETLSIQTQTQPSEPVETTATDFHTDGITSLIEEACVFCNAKGGLVLRCCGNSNDNMGCKVVFHPLCAWFQGLYVDTHINDPSFQGTDRDGLYPSCLSIKFFCDSHAPLEYSGSKRLDQQLLRAKYRLKEEDLDGIPGLTKRKKKKKTQQKSGANSSSSLPSQKTVTGASAQASKDLLVDVYGSNTCGICLAPIIPLVPDEDIPPILSVSSNIVTTTSSISNADNIACSKCGITFHLNCLVSNGIIPPALAVIALTSPWQCTTCARDKIDVRCVLCPRRGGFHVPATGFLCSQDSWAHLYCTKYSRGIFNKSASSTVSNGSNNGGGGGGGVDIKQIPKENRKQKCIICKHKVGVSERCAFLGCTNYFHSMCLEKSNRGYIRARQGTYEGYCYEHIPEGIEKLPSGYWADGYEIYRLRQTLEQTRLILDMVIRREKFKKNLNKVETDCFQEKAKRMLDRCMGRRPPSGSSVLNYDSDGSIDDGDDNDAVTCISEGDHHHPTEFPTLADAGGKDVMYYDDWIPGYIPAYIIANKDTNSAITVTLKNGQTVTIGSSWVTNEGTLRLPSDIIVGVAGIEVEKRRTKMEGGHSAYIRTFNHEVDVNLDMSRRATQIFESQKEFLDFRKRLPVGILKHLGMSERDFIAEMIKRNVLPTSHPSKFSQSQGQGQAKKIKLKKGYSLTTTDEADNNNGVIRQEQPILLPPPSSSGRQQRSSTPKAVAAVKVPTVMMDEHDVVEDHHQSSRLRSSRSSGGLGGVVGVAARDKRRYVLDSDSDDITKPVPHRDRDGDRERERKKSSEEGRRVVIVTDLSVDKFAPVSVIGSSRETSRRRYSSSSSSSSTQQFPAPVPVSVHIEPQQQNKKKLLVQSKLDLTPSSSSSVRSRRLSEGPAAIPVSVSTPKDNNNAAVTTTTSITSERIKKRAVPKEDEEENIVVVVNPPMKLRRSSSLSSTAAVDTIASKPLHVPIPIPIVADVTTYIATRRKSAAPVTTTIPKEKPAMIRQISEVLQVEGGEEEEEGSVGPVLSSKVRRARLTVSEASAAAAIAAAGPHLITAEYGLKTVFTGFGDRMNTSEEFEEISSYDFLYTHYMDGTLWSGPEAGAGDDWVIFAEDELPVLERRIFDVLASLECYEISNTDDSCTISKSTSRGRGRRGGGGKGNGGGRTSSNGKKKGSRILVEDFKSIPESFVSMYKQYIRHFVTIEVMKDKLQRHYYRSMAAFSKDFYDMLNNARSATDPNSQTWVDSAALAKIFEEVKGKSLLKAIDREPAAAGAYTGAGALTRVMFRKIEKQVPIYEDKEEKEEESVVVDDTVVAAVDVPPLSPPAIDESIICASASVWEEMYIQLVDNVNIDSVFAALSFPPIIFNEDNYITQCNALSSAALDSSLLSGGADNECIHVLGEINASNGKAPSDAIEMLSVEESTCKHISKNEIGEDICDSDVMIVDESVSVPIDDDGDNIPQETSAIIIEEAIININQCDDLSTDNGGQVVVPILIDSHIEYTTSSSSSSSSFIQQHCCRCFQEYVIENWPGSGLPLGASLSSESDVLTTIKNNFAAFESSSSNRTCAWAVQILKSCCNSLAFQYPPDHLAQLGRVKKHQHKDLELKWRSEWNAGLKSVFPWGVICPYCIESGSGRGFGLVGCCVKVWWIDDDCAYEGVVNAYDLSSGKHRVLYDDGQWEFIDLKDQPALFTSYGDYFISSIHSSSSSSSSSKLEEAQAPTSTSTTKRSRGSSTEVPVIIPTRNSSRNSSNNQSHTHSRSHRSNNITTGIYTDLVTRHEGIDTVTVSRSHSRKRSRHSEEERERQLPRRRSVSLSEEGSASSISTRASPRLVVHSDIVVIGDTDKDDASKRTRSMSNLSAHSHNTHALKSDEHNNKPKKSKIIDEIQIPMAFVDTEPPPSNVATSKPIVNSNIDISEVAVHGDHNADNGNVDSTATEVVSKVETSYRIRSNRAVNSSSIIIGEADTGTGRNTCTTSSNESRDHDNNNPEINKRTSPRLSSVSKSGPGPRAS